MNELKDQNLTEKEHINAEFKLINFFNDKDKAEQAN